MLHSNGVPATVSAHPIENLSSFLVDLVDRIKALEQKMSAEGVDTSTGDPHAPIGVTEASRLLRLSESRVYVLSSEGKIPCHRRGGRLYFFKDELTSLIRSSDSTSKISRNKKAVAL